MIFFASEATSAFSFQFACNFIFSSEFNFVHRQLLDDVGELLLKS